jgi:transcription-repair coupling factor (superfamily II helicase)
VVSGTPGATGGGATSVFGVPEGWDAVLLARRLREHAGPLVHVCRDDLRMARLGEALGFFAPQIAPLRFPAWDCLPYDRASPDPALVSERVAALAALAEAADRPRLVLTTINALVQKVPPAEAWRGASMELMPGGRVDVAELARFLDANGYGRAGTVMEPGEYAIRGGIVDIFPAGAAEPVRIDLFGDTIESLRSFDPASQRSGARQQVLSLRPISEVPLDRESIARFRTGWRELFGAAAADDPLYGAVSEGRRHPGMEHFLPLFYPRMVTLLDLLLGASCSLDYQVEEGLAARLEMIADHYEARRQPLRTAEVPYRPLPPDRLYLDHAGWRQMLGRAPLFSFGPFGRPEGVAGVDGGGRPGPLFTGTTPEGGGNPFEQLRALHERWRVEGRRLLLAAWTRGSCERLGHLLREHGLATEMVGTWREVGALAEGVAALAVLGLERGFLADDAEIGRLAVVSEQDLLGERIARPPRRRKRADQLIAEATELAEGDLVVHQDHGIGRYDGLVTLTVNEAPHDCLRILYDGDGTLFLPVENIEMLSRFGADGAGVALDRLGGVAWQHRKARAKERIREMAGALIRTAAERKLRAAEVMVPAPGSFEEFCARFPHPETEDQTRAIADVLEDLASGQPMDRLICGDVGFGKTEVALRAAFVAAMAGCQVAVVVPTTLLARQHFRTFQERFRGLPVKVAQLSRMVPAREAALVRRELADGTVSIVVGTHALLAKHTQFAALGLLVVDEEQHFGVAHKEKLKALKADVHVLTLTATPIPRTLQLALSGVREMSLIATPPVDRLAVRTFIMPFDGVVIREAILRERFRGGQVFCVVPRIDHLAPIAERLAELVPEARIARAHGRLAPTELERVMTDFSDGKYEILLSTNIVESGLDMPAVNTLVIHHADLFGLGQLYQLRGRIGRGKQRGYAYLTWPPNTRLSPAAEKRLAVMHSLDALGAGFTLASHDLDIRGAGNLLGDEQSGHIREVGIELYQQMLEEAVADLRAEQGQARPAGEEWSPTINLGLPVLIPESYVADLPVRLGLYRRIGNLVSDAESEAMAAELVDRFGRLPEEVENLLGVVALKRACRSAGVEKLEAGPKGVVLSFHRNTFANPAGLVRWLASRGGAVRLRPDHRLALARDLAAGERLRVAGKLVAELNRLVRGERAA